MQLLLPVPKSINTGFLKTDYYEHWRQDGSTLIDFETTLCHTGQGTKRTQPQDGAPDPKKPRRRPYCGNCTGCLEINNCGICDNCK